MRTIEVSDETFRSLEARVKNFGDTPELIIRQLLRAPAGTQQESAEQGLEREVDRVSPALRSLIESADFSRKTSKEKYLGLLQFLHLNNPELFAGLTKVRFGGKRLQIADSPEKIRNSGRSTFPEAIGRTGYWALTNLSNRSKRDVLIRCMHELRYQREDILFATRSIPDTKLARSAAEILEEI